MEYSDDSQEISTHVRQFIQGLFGKGDMMLFGCGNAWKLESDNSFPSMLNLKGSKGSIVVPVMGGGKTLKIE
jgi:hypothetical protein